MGSKILNHLKILVILAIIIAFVWFLAVYPTYKFKKYEEIVKQASLRYYELNPTKLPTGERVSTVSLQTLFNGAYIKEDLYIPYSKKACSVTKSWVKVTRKDNKYDYIVYLECGALKSIVDHTGPKITLKGEQEMTIEVNSDFKDPGISKIYDKKDGNINIEKAVIKSNVDIKNTGEYKIEYTASDKLGNKTTVERTIHIINTLNSQVKKILGKEKRFKGNPTNNNIKISNMNFKIVGIDDKKNVIVVAEHPVSYINYNKIEKWLNDYYYKLLSDETKKMIIKSNYCQSVKDISSTECSKKTEEKNIYYPSVVDVNLSEENDNNFMKTDQLSWINAKENEISSIGIYNQDFYGSLYKNMDKTSISTIRPMFTIDGKEKILSGDGSKKYPFKLKDNKEVVGEKKTTELSIGDIIKHKGIYYIVIDQLSDGTTKVISYSYISSFKQIAKITNTEETPLIYNPTKKTNIGFKINNQLANYIDKSIFVAHSIEVPIYKNHIIYGTETKKSKYKVLYSAPNIFEIFSTHNYVDDIMIDGSAWFVNSSQEVDTGVTIDGYGNVNETVYPDDSNGVRVVAYIKKDQYVSSGNGSYNDPYTIR